MALGIPENVFLSRLDALANWVRKNSLWPMPFATACCGIELMATGASRHDIARFGAEVMRFSPRQCDLMIVAGRVVMKMLPVLQRIWLQMPEPKWCISMGACACSGGVFDTYAVVQGVDRFIPVDVYVPGCPPRPEQLTASVIALQERIERTGTLTGREFAQRITSDGPPVVQPLPDKAIVAPGDALTSTRLWQVDLPPLPGGVKTAFPELEEDQDS
ncbi:MAG: NADH-quinone oxidoreductase subunit B [Gemmataceae bacterium]